MAAKCTTCGCLLSCPVCEDEDCGNAVFNKVAAIARITRRTADAQCIDHQAAEDRATAEVKRLRAIVDLAHEWRATTERALAAHLASTPPEEMRIAWLEMRTIRDKFGQALARDKNR